MKSKIILNLTLAVFVMLSLTGCKKKSSKKPAEPNEASMSQSTITQEGANTIPEVKSIEQYKAEAEKEITKENYQDELNSLEKEIEQDISRP